MPAPVHISVVIITFNEEKNIARCIDSVSTVADEIIVVDSFSSDKTREICVRKNVKFIEHFFEGYIEQKNFANAQATYPYILSMDADEALSPQLASSIAAVKQDWTRDAYSMNRLSSYAGKWIRHCGWYPDRKIRLWDSRKGTWGGERIHEKLLLEPGYTEGHLQGNILHYAYQNSSQLIAKIQQYSAIYAEHNRFKKQSSVFKIIYKFVFAFFRTYVLKRGFLDGYEGFIISASHANGVLYKYAKLHEANRYISISLIITTYNRPDALELVLLSVLNQIVMPKEVIIADDGSTEETSQLIARYQKQFTIPLIHCWHEDQGFRLSHIRNKAIAQASGEYMVMVDGDMVLHKQFIKNHKNAARINTFVQGSRVILTEQLTRQALTNKHISFSPFQQGIINRLNAMHIGSLSALFSLRKKTKLKGIRGCNMAFWKDDVLRVNGFNEDFTGWGREDSEFVVRLFNNAISRQNLKFGGVAYHLYHPENTRKDLSQNDRILDKVIQEKVKVCDNGISKYVKI
jgi:glycosyltransferase involved in cell wall biosynthesis